MQTIETKDGIILNNVPDNVSDEQIKARINQIRAGGQQAANTPQPVQQPVQQPMQQAELTPAQKATQAIQKGHQKRQQDAISILGEFGGDQITGQEATLQLLGKSIEGGYQLLSEGVKTSGRGLALLTPQPIFDYLKETLGPVADQFMASPAGQYLKDEVTQSVEGLRTLAQENPRAAKDIEAALLVTPAALALKKGFAARPAVDVGPVRSFKPDKGITTIRDFKRDYKEMLKPVQGKAARQAAVPHSKVSPLAKTITHKSTDIEKQIIPLLRQNKINPKDLYTENFLKIMDLEDGLRKGLIGSLKAAKIKINRKGVVEQVNAALEKVYKTEDVFALKGTQTIRLVSEQLKRNLIKRPDDLSSLLEIRKRLDKLGDQFMKFDKKTRKSFDGHKSIAYKTARDEINKILIAKAKPHGIDVERIFKEQHLFIESMKVLQPKAALELSTKGARIAEKIGDKRIPLISKWVDPRTALKRNK